MLSLVMLDANVVLVCAAAGGVKNKSAIANLINSWQWRRARPSENICRSVRLLFAYGLYVEKTMLRDIEVITINIRTAALGIRPAVGTLLGELIGIDFL
jgi:hypothetical protein